MDQNFKDLQDQIKMKICKKNVKVVEECGVGHVAVDEWKRKTSDTSEWCSASASLGKGLKGRIAAK